MYVYAIGAGRQFIKFGVSNDPIKRIAFFNTGSPLEMVILSQTADMSRKEAFLCEKTIHHAVMDFHARLEWYKSCPKTLALCNLIKNQSPARVLEIARGWATQDGFIQAEKKCGMQRIGDGGSLDLMYQNSKIVSLLTRKG